MRATLLPLVAALLLFCLAAGALLASYTRLDSLGKADRRLTGAPERCRCVSMHLCVSVCPCLPACLHTCVRISCLLWQRSCNSDWPLAPCWRATLAWTSLAWLTGNCLGYLNAVCMFVCLSVWLPACVPACLHMCMRVTACVTGCVQMPKPRSAL